MTGAAVPEAQKQTPADVSSALHGDAALTVGQVLLIYDPEINNCENKLFLLPVNFKSSDRGVLGLHLCYKPLSRQPFF